MSKRACFIHNALTILTIFAIMVNKSFAEEENMGFNGKLIKLVEEFFFSLDVSEENIEQVTVPAIEGQTHLVISKNHDEDIFVYHKKVAGIGEKISFELSLQIFATYLEKLVALQARDFFFDIRPGDNQIFGIVIKELRFTVGETTFFMNKYIMVNRFESNRDAVQKIIELLDEMLD